MIQARAPSSLHHLRLVCRHELVDTELATESGSNRSKGDKKVAVATAEDGEDDERFLRDLDNADAWLRRLNSQSEALRTR